MRKRDVLIVFAAVAAALTLAVGQLFWSPVPAGAWGLSFQTQGQAPVGPLSGADLARLGAVYVGDPEEKVLYLTFDAGYENGQTEKILDTLNKYNVPAAFFLVGHYLETNPDLVRRMVAEGHIVGNHTMHHPDMSRLDREGVIRELQQPEDLFREITGKELPKYYRPPQGNYSRESLEIAGELGYHTVFWSLAYGDWDNANQPSAETALSKLLPRTHNGAVVLLHATSATNGAVLDTLLARWTAMGYRFESLDRLF